MSQPLHQPPPPPRWLSLAVLAAASGYVLIGLFMMLWASPKVPYADSYRFLTTFLERPFPENVLAADNGHREVLTNLVRLAELHWLHANQWLQTLVGVAGLLTATLVAMRTLRCEPADRRIAAFGVLAIGLYWLGNARKLAHGSEAAHLGLILTFLMIGSRGLCQLTRACSARPVWFAALLGVLATLSFGSGVATFLAFAVLLLLARATPQQWLPLAAGASSALLLLLLGGGGERATIEIAPLAQFDLWLRWLGAPFIWLLSPLLDPEHAARLPTALLSESTASLARLTSSWFGPALQARWPAFAFGAAGLAALLLSSRRVWRGSSGPGERFALALGWFGAGVGLLVVTLRTTYFHKYPDQLTSQRYVPWSMLLWLGLALLYVLRCDRAPRRCLAFVLLMSLLFAPSQVWLGRTAFRLQETAELTALGVAVGVLDRNFPLVETVDRDLVAAIVQLRAARAAMFAWPQVAVLETAPPVARLLEQPCTDRHIAPIENRLGEPGAAVTFACTADGDERLLLLDEGGVVRGLAIRVREDERWHGWWRGAVPSIAPRVAALR